MESKRNTEDLYNIKTYTDEELYEILDLTNDPTDRELEAKILYYIHKYTNMAEKSSKKLAKFFDDIYNHFFDVDSEEEELIMEGFEAGGLSYEDALVEGNIDLNKKYKMTGNINDPNSAALTIKEQQDIAGNIKLDPTKYYSPQEKTVDQASGSISGVTFTKSLDYATGRLNPLIQQTIKRIVSVDSKYRDDKRTLSTDFTFILNEPLKDVVSLKLYSIQIPYSWYTVNTNFGGNFFYLMGVTPGIDNEFHNILIDISAGNYDGPGLGLTINKSILEKTIVYGDVSFGNSNVNINSFTSLTTAQFCLEKKYDENAYYLDFDGCGVSPTSIGVQAALGFSNQIYYPNTLVSIPFNRSNTDPGFYTTGSYALTSYNNYIHVVMYRGPNEWDHTSIIKWDASFNIRLSLSTSSASTYYSRSQILDNFNEVITSFSDYLSNDSGLTDPTYNSTINTNYIIPNYQTPLCYQLKIKPNRSYVRDISNVKIAINFPVESLQNRIWTGGVTSCFGFYTNDSSWNEMSDIISENPIIANSGNYSIDTGNYILLTCNDPDFKLSANDISINIQPYPTGYTFTEYIDAINSAISNSGTRIIGSNNLNNSTINSSNAFKDENEFFNLSLVINQSFNESLYELDLRNSIIKTIFNKTKTTDFISVTGSLTNIDNQISYINNGVHLENTNIVIAETTDANNIKTITGLTGNITTTGLTYINNNDIKMNSNVVTTNYILTTVENGSLYTTNNSSVTITGKSNISLTNKTINFDNNLTVVGSLTISKQVSIVGNKINDYITFNLGEITSYGRTEIEGLFQINNLSNANPISISGNVNTTGLITLNTLTTITPYTNNSSLISANSIILNGTISTTEELKCVFLKSSSVYVINSLSAVSESFENLSFTNNQYVNIENNSGIITFGTNESNFNINFESIDDMLNIEVTGSINNDNDLTAVVFSLSMSDITSITGTGVVSTRGITVLNNAHTATLSSNNSIINIANATINITGAFSYTLSNGQTKTISNKNSLSVILGSISITGKGSIDITTLSSGDVNIKASSVIYGENTATCVTNINSQNITLNGSISVLNNYCNTDNTSTSIITQDGLSVTTTNMVTVYTPTVIGIINTGTLSIDSTNKLTTILNYVNILGPPTIQLISGFIENTYENTSSYVLLNGTMIIDKSQTGSDFIINGTIDNTGIITNNGPTPNDVTINSEGNIINGTNINVYGSSIITGSLTNSLNKLLISSNSVTSLTGNITIPLSNGQVQINLTDRDIKINGKLVIDGKTVTIENTANIYYLTDLTKTYINSSAENRIYSINNGDNIGIFYAKRKTGEGNDNSVSYNIYWNNRSATYTNIVSFISAIQEEITSFADTLTGLTLFGNSIFETTLNVDRKTAILKMKININKKLLAKNYSIQFFSQTNLNTWYRNLKIDEILFNNAFFLNSNAVTYSSYQLFNTNKIIQVGNDGSVLIKGFSPIDVLSNPITFTTLNNSFYLRAYENGVYSRNRENDVKLTIPITYSNGILIEYSIDKLIYTIQQVINSVTGNVSINNTIINSISVFENGTTNNYAKIRFNIKRTYAIKDYQLVFYDTTSFVQCYSGVSSVKNITWDTTLGWLLGFQAQFTYNFADYSAVNGYISITGDSVLILNLYNYFIICIDDYNSNQINDGLVTIAGKDNNNPLPSYSNIYNNLTCDPANGSITYNGTGLTQNQIYSITEIYNTNLKNNQPLNKIYSSTPSVKNVFGILPIKPGNNGQTFVEYGGTLQNQDRTYYGPVNINRMSVTLYTDRGDVLNLNGANWSFSVICEQLSNLKAKN